MVVAKQQLMLEVAYELVAKVHSDICNGKMSKRHLAEDSMEILRKIVILSRNLERKDTK